MGQQEARHPELAPGPARGLSTSGEKGATR